MAARCTVCDHPNAREVDALVLAGGRSLRSIAAAFHLGEKAVQRHAARHVARQGSPRARRASHAAPGDAERAEHRLPAPGAPTADPATELRAQLADLNAVDAGELTPTGRIALYDAKRRVVEALARVEPPGPSGSVGLWEVDGMRDLFDALMDGLEPHPDIRLSLLDRLRSSGVLARLEGEAR